MAAFSSYHENNMNPLLLDSLYLQNHPNMAMKIMSGFMEDGNSNMIMNSNCFSQFYPPEAEPAAQETTPGLEDNETRKQSSESSTVVDKLESGEQVTQKPTSIDKKRRTRNGCSPNSAQSKDAREGRGKKQKQCNGEAKEKQNNKPKAEKKEQKKQSVSTDHQEPPTGYIHVRARRGQATDSHSLAERVRREKISERMKVLQRLVPGCDKITGKALMLDEIINYVQSLQNQVEFLSMKLASVNPLFYDFGMDQDSFIFRSSERVNYMQTSSAVPQCSPNQPTVFADTSAIPSAFTQDNGSLLWDVEEQGQKFLNPSGFNDNLCSFN